MGNTTSSSDSYADSNPEEKLIQDCGRGDEGFVRKYIEEKVDVNAVSQVSPLLSLKCWPLDFHSSSDSVIILYLSQFDIILSV